MRILSLFIFVIPFFLSLEESFALCDLESSTASKFLQDCAASANNGGGTISIQP